MSARALTILIIVGLCLTTLSCSWDPPTPSRYQNTVDAFVSLVRDQGGVPKHLRRVKAVKRKKDFDVNEVFSVLTHLSMQPGYVLDYVYFYTGVGGEPVIYARPVDQKPYRNYSKYEKAEGKTSFRESWHRAMNRVQVDGTAEGFFEFAVLRIMGRQFYRYWHASYNDALIICDPAGLEALLSIYDGEKYMSLPSDVQEKARALDFQPVVEIGDETVLVRVVIFTNWGGFIRVSYSISRDFPHEVLQEERETLVEYDCGIRL